MKTDYSEKYLNVKTGLLENSPNLKLVINMKIALISRTG